MSFLSPSFGCLDGNSFGKFLALVLPNPCLARVLFRGSQVRESLTFNIITLATSQMFAVHTCPDGPLKTERRVTSQFTSDKNPLAGRRLSVDDFVSRCVFNITGESYHGAASGWLSVRR